MKSGIGNVSTYHLAAAIGMLLAGPTQPGLIAAPCDALPEDEDERLRVRERLACLRRVNRFRPRRTRGVATALATRGTGAGGTVRGDCSGALRNRGSTSAQVRPV